MIRKALRYKRPLLRNAEDNKKVVVVDLFQFLSSKFTRAWTGPWFCIGHVMSKEKRQFYSILRRLLPSLSRMILFKLDGQCLPELKPEIKASK